MKAFIFLSMIVLSSVGLANLPLPDATYVGQGQLTRLSDGSHFFYDVSYVIQGDSATANYSYPSGLSYTLSFTVLNDQHGQFVVQQQGQTVGSGYCVGSSCQVDADFVINGITQHISFHLTYDSSQNNLVISGYNATSNTIWEDVLK